MTLSLHFHRRDLAELSEVMIGEVRTAASGTAVHVPVTGESCLEGTAEW
jgi:hypothetical protein